MKGKPFALIGVNSDPKAKVQAALKRENITWRSFWDGGGRGGPIARSYSIQGWPTLYLIDQQGIIRFKGHGSPADKMIDEMVAKGGTVGGPVASAAPAAMREFVDITGQFKIRAKFVDFKGGKAFLEREGGEVIGISMAKLSAADQKYIRDLLKNK